eukprot:TRINITY_DN27052_c0_g3_i1.p3 TRINITY_DN27052_c0_g3~~TRINITY_DN27052_c0_g3_i1.p3  ORF type:complete len:176 (+),score=44.78 TRINITY_DN27052_c0_g3_i1:73-528(+)
MPRPIAPPPCSRGQAVAGADSGTSEAGPRRRSRTPPGMGEASASAGLDASSSSSSSSGGSSGARSASKAARAFSFKLNLSEHWMEEYGERLEELVAEIKAAGLSDADIKRGLFKMEDAGGHTVVQDDEEAGSVPGMNVSFPLTVHFQPADA